MIHSPAVVRARAGLLATEQGLLGLAAGTSLVSGLLAWRDAEGFARLFGYSTWLTVGLATAGVTVTVVARVLDVGEAPRQAPVMHAWFVPLVAAAVWVLAAACASVALHEDGRGFGVGTIAALAAGMPASIVVLAALALRSAATCGQDSETVLSELGQPIGHGMLGGAAAILLIGLISGQITAGLTYKVGVAITALAAATLFATALSVRRARRRLHVLSRDGGRFPVAEQAYRLAAGATVLGLLLPAVIVVADLLAARLTLLVVAAAAMAVSNHALRYALVACALSSPKPARRGFDSAPTALPHSARFQGHPQ